MEGYLNIINNRINDLVKIIHSRTQKQWIGSFIYGFY